MTAKLSRSDLPDLRDFLDNLPMKPCPTKLPEEYCKICRRLNKNVATFCETHELPERPEKEELEEIRPPMIERIEKEESPEPSYEHRRSPILERPVYDEGETSLEFAPSERSIEEALHGGYDFLDGFVSCRACDNIWKMSSIWQYNFKLPFSHYIVLPHTSSVASMKFLHRELGVLLHA